MSEKNKKLSAPHKNIVGEPFDPYVAYQVETRQKTQYTGYDEGSLRDNSDISILDNQNAWVKLASSVDVSGSLGEERLRSLGLEKDVNILNGTQLAESAILFNTLSSIEPNKGTSAASGANIPISMREGISKSNKLWNSNKSYGLGGTDFGILPAPGIKGVTVNCMNRGSIRKAKVELKAYNKFQFSIIEMLYLRLGHHMILEWGNDKFINNDGELETMGSTIVEKSWFNQQEATQLSMIKEIEGYRAKYSANYDGFFGRVVNFTWDFGPDGSYDISIDLITVGDVIESLTVNNPSPYLGTKDLKEGKQNNNSNEENTNVNEESDTLLDLFLLANLKFAEEEKTNKDYFVLENKEKESDNKKIVDKYKYYVTLGELLNQIESLCIPRINYHDEISNGYGLVEFYPPDCVSYSLNLISLDPRVCLLKPKFTENTSKVISKPGYLDPLLDYVEQDGDIVYGNLNHLYLNYEFIRKCLKNDTDDEGNLSLFKFLKAICTGVNGALGNTTKLEPVIRDDRYITIIDQNPIPGIEGKFKDRITVPLEVYGYNPTSKQSNFVTNIAFQTSITPELSTTISIGATAAGSTVKGVEGTAFQKWNAGLVDRFWEGTTSPTSKVPTELNRVTDSEIKAQKEELGNYFDNYSGFFSSLVQFFGSDDKYIDHPLVPLSYYNKKEFIDKGIKNFKTNRDKEVDENALREEENTNYILYLGACFGNSAVTFEAKGGVVRIPYRSPNNGNYIKFDSSFIGKGRKVYNNFIKEEDRERFRESLKEEKLDKLVASNQVGFIPVNFDINLKGISGFKIYQKIEINQKFLPPQYPNTLEFLVTKVDHIIRDNNWTTGLTTLSVPKIKETIKESTGIKDVNLENDNLEVDTEYITIENDLPLRFRDATANGKNPRVLDVEYLNSPPSRGWFEANFNQNVYIGFEQFFSNMINNPKLKGHTVFIKSTYRSPEEQQALVDAGATSTKPGRSLHNYGAAVDIVIAPPRKTSKGIPIHADPKILTLKKFDSPEAQNWLLKNRRKELWENSGVVENAKDAGLSWAGDWKSADSYKDYVHFYIDEKKLISRDDMEAALVEFGGGDKLIADGRKVNVLREA